MGVNLAKAAFVAWLVAVNHELCVFSRDTTEKSMLINPFVFDANELLLRVGIHLSLPCVNLLTLVSKAQRSKGKLHEERKRLTDIFQLI